MSDPKFQIGQAVAVFSLQSMVAIPATTIVDVAFVPKGAIREQYGTGEKCRQKFDKYVYVVDKLPGYSIAEACLRPIDPDKEYQDEQEQEKTA